MFIYQFLKLFVYLFVYFDSIGSVFVLWLFYIYYILYADILNPDVAANGREDKLIRHTKKADRMKHVENGVTRL